MPTVSGGRVETIGQLTVSEWSEFIKNEIELMLDRKRRNCLGCINFVGDSQLCGLNGQMPPPKIAINGCELWEEEIPF